MRDAVAPWGRRRGKETDSRLLVRHEAHSTEYLLSPALPRTPASAPCPHCPQAKFSMQMLYNRSHFLDKQLVKMQENPNEIPEGETPHTVSMFARQVGLAGGSSGIGRRVGFQSKARAWHPHTWPGPGRGRLGQIGGQEMQLLGSGSAIHVWPGHPCPTLTLHRSYCPHLLLFRTWLTWPSQATASQ